MTPRLPSLQRSSPKYGATWLAGAISTVDPLDVAEAGGWKTLETLNTAYQQADAETMLRVVLEPVKLREAR